MWLEVAYKRGTREMFWLRACPKCHGDLYQGKDMYGKYVACMQCSHYLTAAEEDRIKAVQAVAASPATRHVGVPAERIAA